MENAKRTVIFQGLHTLYLKGLRDHLDIKIFTCPDELLRLAWKLERDTKNRGHSPRAVIENLEKRAVDSEKHIKPQQFYADWIIKYYPIEKLDTQDIINGKKYSIGVDHILWNDFPANRLAKVLGQSKNCKAEVHHPEQYADRVVLKVKGAITTDEVFELAYKMFPNVRSILRSRDVPVWRDGLDGVSQLVAITLLRNNLDSTTGIRL